jgi:hypothetical protein
MVIAIIALLFFFLIAKTQLARAWRGRSCFHFVTLDVYRGGAFISQQLSALGKQ